MKKPFGVTASAIVALLGSLLMLGLCVVLCLVLVLSPGRGPMPPETKLGMVLGLGIFGFLGAWGTATAIGLLRLRNWGRVSILIFATLLALTGVVAAPAILLIPAPPTAPPNFNAIRAGMAVFYGVLGALGALWLYYFSRRDMRGLRRSTDQREWRTSAEHFHYWLVVAGKRSDQCIDVAAENAGKCLPLDRERMDGGRVVFHSGSASCLHRLWTASTECNGAGTCDYHAVLWCGEWSRILLLSRQRCASCGVHVAIPFHSPASANAFSWIHADSQPGWRRPASLVPDREEKGFSGCGVGNIIDLLVTPVDAAPVCPSFPRFLHLSVY